MLPFFFSVLVSGVFSIVKLEFEIEICFDTTNACFKHEYIKDIKKIKTVISVR